MVAEVLSEPVSVPATAGGWEVDPEGAIFPRAEVAAVVTVAGVRAVRLGLVEPAGADGWSSGVFTAAGVRHLIAALEAKLAVVEPPCALRVVA